MAISKVDVLGQCGASDKAVSLIVPAMASRAFWILRKMFSPFALQTYRQGLALCSARNAVMELASSRVELKLRLRK